VFVTCGTRAERLSWRSLREITSSRQASAENHTGSKRRIAGRYGRLSSRGPVAAVLRVDFSG
jgi:hypothetical protein